MKKIILFLLFIPFWVSAQLTIKDIVTYKFYPDYLSDVVQLPDGSGFVYLDYTGYGSVLKKYDYNKKDFEDLVVFPYSKGVVYGFEFNDNADKILIYKKRKRIYRHSFKADYYLYDLKTKEEILIDNQIQAASFMPNSDNIIFVKDNNLWYYDFNTSQNIQITFDGEKNKIINGIPDWVYEEEFSLFKTYAGSPDGRYLAYVKFNEERVKKYCLKFYAGEKPHYSEYEIYPGIYEYKYPKAGEKNSIVSVHIYDFKTKKTYDLNTYQKTDDFYIPRIVWNKDEKNPLLMVFVENRLQNNLKFYLYSPSDNFKGKLIYTEKNKYYIETDFFDYFQFLPNSNLFVFLSEKSGFNHIYTLDVEKKQVKQITDGNFDITDFYGFDDKKKVFYFQAAKENPTEREIYSVSLKKKKINKITETVGYNSAVFSADYQYFIHTYSSIDKPPIVEVVNIKKGDKNIIFDNAHILKMLDSVGYKPNAEIKNIKVAKNVDLYVKILYPENFDSTKKYPLIINQYSGPNVNSVYNRWSISWLDYMAENGFMVVTVDTRGTGARGEKFKKITYKRLGIYETEDLRNTAKYFAKLPYVDEENIGIWGWSYGGFMVLNCLTNNDDLTFKAGVAIAPVTNWRFYDNIYTERYMQRPQDNEKGYEETAPLNRAEKLKGNLLICTGLVDDNVHPQNTFEFVEKLVQNNINFEMYTFTNRNHSIYGGKTRLFLFTRFIEFFERNLKSEK